MKSKKVMVTVLVAIVFASLTAVTNSNASEDQSSDLKNSIAGLGGSSGSGTGGNFSKNQRKCLTALARTHRSGAFAADKCGMSDAFVTCFYKKIDETLVGNQTALDACDSEVNESKESGLDNFG